MGFDERRVTIESDGARLEGALHDGSGDLALLMLHPHPLYGGDMDNHVVISICRAAARLGATTMRFNFRGAGESTGGFDHGNGERFDAIAAAEVLMTAHPRARLVLAGYSFGAMVASRVAPDLAPAAVVLVSPPPSLGIERVAGDVPALFAAGGLDQLVPRDGLLALAEPRHTVAVVDGADHGWSRGVDLLLAEVAAFLEALA